MGMVTVAEYRLATGDSTSATGTVDAALTAAEELLAEWLGRPDTLTEAERTELLDVDYYRRVYPRATPITVAPSGWTIRKGGRYLESDSILGRSFLTGRDDVSITYTGGYTAATLPQTLKEAIAWTAYERVRVATALASVPVGAQSVTVGDVTVNYGTTGAGGGGTGGVIPLRAQQLARRYRRRSP